MQTWLSIDEFVKFTGKDKKEIIALCRAKKLNCKKQDGEIYIQIEANSLSVMPSNKVEIIEKEHSIAEKTIAAFLNLHEKVLMSKDETIEVLKDENEFLKESLIKIQEDYETQKKTIERLQKQLEICQDELEFCRRKYKLMWGQVLKKEQKEE